MYIFKCRENDTVRGLLEKTQSVIVDRVWKGDVS